MDPIDQKLFERIDAYLRGQMDVEERTAFEIQLKTDQHLSNELEVQKMLLESIDAGSMQLEMDEIHEKHFSHAEHETSSLGLWKIAAGIALILGIGSLLLLNNENKQDVLFAEYVTVDPGLPITMGANDEYAFSDGMVSYKEGHYQEALTTWETITSIEIASDKLSYYKACAHFNLEEYKQALPFMNALINDAQSDFHDRAVWYACLSYLQLKKDQEILSLSPINSSPYYDRIESIKQELRE